MFEKTNMEKWQCQFNESKMTRTFDYTFFTCGTSKRFFIGAKLSVKWTKTFRGKGRFLTRVKLSFGDLHNSILFNVASTEQTKL